MGLMDFLINPYGGQLKLLKSVGGSGAEDALSRIPVVNTITGSKTDSEKALEAKQKQLAEDLKKRQRLMEQTRLNSLGQQMLAFNPQNQMMAQMFGPEAAFTPQQFAQMAADPMAKSQSDYDAAYAESRRTGQPMKGWTQEDADRMRADQRRQAMVQQNMQAPGPGPKPIQMTPAQGARKF